MEKRPQHDESEPRQQWCHVPVEVLYKVPRGQFPDVAVLQWSLSPSGFPLPQPGPAPLEWASIGSGSSGGGGSGGGGDHSSRGGSSGGSKSSLGGSSGFGNHRIHGSDGHHGRAAAEEEDVEEDEEEGEEWPADGTPVAILGFPLFERTDGYKPQPIAVSGVLTTKPTMGGSAWISAAATATARENGGAAAAAAAAAAGGGGGGRGGRKRRDPKMEGLKRPSPSVLLTSAPVHPGCSGGPVIDMRDGSLIGIMTSFLQCMDDDGELIVSFPRPVTTLFPPSHPLCYWLPQRH